MQDPVVAQDSKCAHNNVRVPRIGNLHALADSGAQKSAISYDFVRDAGIEISPCQRVWRVANGSGGGIVGQVSISVLYEHTQVQMDEVVVFFNMPCALILGIEWMDAAKAWVGVVDHVGTILFGEDVHPFLSSLSSTLSPLLLSLPTEEQTPERMAFEPLPREMSSAIPSEQTPERMAFEPLPCELSSAFSSEQTPERMVYEPQPCEMGSFSQLQIKDDKKFGARWKTIQSSFKVTKPESMRALMVETLRESYRLI